MNCYGYCYYSQEDSYVEVICCKNYGCYYGYPKEGYSFDFKSYGDSLFREIGVDIWTQIFVP